MFKASSELVLSDIKTIPLIFIPIADNCLFPSFESGIFSRLPKKWCEQIRGPLLYDWFVYFYSAYSFV